MAIDNPERFEALLAIADTLSNGETHQNCFGRFQQGYEPAEYEDLCIDMPPQTTSILSY
ncbi:MAG: hypothetical protein J07HQX50_00131 [Haloquadratum sp. J07HQX50]|nr:MAG: hypothetical protein J07HQX50_00131 [Haloquadratum sp. J07HQX50]